MAAIKAGETRAAASAVQTPGGSPGWHAGAGVRLGALLLLLAVGALLAWGAFRQQPERPPWLEADLRARFLAPMPHPRHEAMPVRPVGSAGGLLPRAFWPARDAAESASRCYAPPGAISTFTCSLGVRRASNAAGTASRPITDETSAPASISPASMWRSTRAKSARS